jgi:hypothetical protein
MFLSNLVPVPDVIWHRSSKDEKVVRALRHSSLSLPTSLQTKQKRSMDSASSDDLSISGTSSSSLSATSKQRKKRKKREPTKNHLTVRATIEAGEKWELDLERVHGLTDEEACICVSIACRHLNDEKLPPSNGSRFSELAVEGWKTMRELDRLMKLYPDDLNQDKVDGEWVIFD